MISMNEFELFMMQVEKLLMSYRDVFESRAMWKKKCIQENDKQRQWRLKYKKLKNDIQQK